MIVVSYPLLYLYPKLYLTAAPRASLVGLIIPIIILAVTLIGGLVALKFLNRDKKNGKTSAGSGSKTAQDFINIKDIGDHFLYTNDGLAIVYLRVEGIIVDLLSKSEREHLIRELTADFSDVNFPFKHISVSRPVDISPTLQYWTELLNNTDDNVRKMLLKNEIKQMGSVALSAHIVERQHYISLWDSAEDTHDLMKNALTLMEHFTHNKIGAHILNQAEIVRLVNLVHNPNYVHLEDDNFEATIPLLNLS